MSDCFSPAGSIALLTSAGMVRKKKKFCVSFCFRNLRLNSSLNNYIAKKFNFRSTHFFLSNFFFFYFGKGQKCNYRARQDWDKRNIDHRFTLGVNCKQGLCLAAMFSLLLCLHRALKEITLQSHQAAFPNFILSLQAPGIVARGRRRCARCLSSRPQRLADCVVSQQKHAVCFVSASVFLNARPHHSRTCFSPPAPSRSSQAANGGSWKWSRLTWELILADCPVTGESGGAYEELRLMKAHTSNSLRRTSAQDLSRNQLRRHLRAKSTQLLFASSPIPPRSQHFPLTRARSPI